MVKRYSVDYLECQLGAENVMEEKPDGEWVLYEQYAALENDSHITAQALNSSMDMVRTLDSKCAELESENTRLQAELSSLRNTMETVSDCDACPVCAELAESALKI